MRRRVLAILSIGLACAALAAAQDDPLYATGDQIYSAYHGGDIDHVDLLNGNLSVDIPLMSYPQKGGVLPLEFGFHFQTGPALVTEYCDAEGDPCTEDAPMYNTGFIVGPEGDAYMGNSWTGGDGYTGDWGGFFTISADGMHQFAPASASNLQSYNNLWRALDGTGLLLSWDNVGRDYSITDAHGVKTEFTNWGWGDELEPNQGSALEYTPFVASSRTDASGNTITTQFNGAYGATSGWTDSLGRVIPAPVADTPSAADPYPCPTVAGQTASSSYIWNFPGPADSATPGVSAVKICMTSVYEEYDYYDPDGPGAGFGYANEVQSIVLPNGTSWQFTYASDWSGTLNQIAFPAGGTINYTWSPGPVDKDEDYCSYLCFGFLVHTRTVSAGGGAPSGQWTYSYSYTGTDPYAYPTFTTVVNDPDGGTATHTFTSLDYMSPYETRVVYAGSGESKTVTTSYQYQRPFDTFTGWPLYKTAVNVVPSVVATAWGSTGDTSTTSFSYDTASFYPPYYTPANGTTYSGGAAWTGTLGEVTVKNESGLRKTNTQYVFQSNSSYLAANLLALPSSVQITNGSGTQQAATSFSYDQGTSCICGLATTTSRWVAGGSSLTSTASYNASGEPVDVYDAAGSHTHDDYTAPCYAGSGPTAVTNALGQVTSFCYDADTGLETSVTDPNNQTTTAAYDNMWRTTRIVFPATSAGTGETDYAYSDTPGSVWMETKRLIDNTPRWTDGYDLFDGLGRAIGHSQFNDEGGSTPPWDRVDESYNASGELAFRSYPYFWSSATGAGDSTKPGDTFAYDDFARPTLTTHSDGTTFLTSYAGFATETQDEGNGTQRVTKVTQTDALGRLTSVCEVTNAADAAGNVPASCGLHIGATGFLTTYAYSAPGNLIAATQGAEQRTFGYDGLSRMTGAYNPESGTTTYVYDNDGNCTGDPNDNRAGDLASRTDARGIRTCYAHDALHRLTAKSYSDGTPALTFGYDQGNIWGWTLHNTVGRLSFESTDNGSAAEFFDYDAMGQVVHNGRCTPYTCGWAGYDYLYEHDLAGDLTDSELATQSAGEVSFNYNQEQQVTAVESEAGGGAEVSQLQNIQYDPWGHPVAATAGNGLPESWSYDVRGRATGFNFDTGLYSFSAGVAGDGAVTSANDSVNGNWTYGYDAENRLIASGCTANCPDGAGTQGFSYSYDRYGNRWQQSVTAGSGPAPSFSFTGNNNHMDGYSYDAAGDLLNDGLDIYSYDAEQRVISAAGGGTAASYVYGPDGERWSATVDGVTTETVTGQGWSRAVFNLSPGWSVAEADLEVNGSTALVYNGTTPYLNLTNWLSTARMRATPAGSAQESDTGLPFGDGLAVTGASESNLHFTDKPRDAGSNLDYFGARYYNAMLGRFMSPDWSEDPEPTPYADLTNPQTLNLYAYVGNNPTTNTDADGHREDIYFKGGGGLIFDTDADYAAFWKEWNGWDGTYYPAPGNSGYVTRNDGEIGYAYWSQDNPNWARAVYDSIGRDIAAEKAKTIGMDVRSLLMLGAPGGDLGEAAEAGEAVIEGVSKLADLENLSPKIVRQMGSRGWTADEIAETIKSGKQFEVVNKATGGRAIEYFNESSGRFVVVDRTTGKILQVSGEGFLPNHLQP